MIDMHYALAFFVAKIHSSGGGDKSVEAIDAEMTVLALRLKNVSRNTERFELRLLEGLL